MAAARILYLRSSKFNITLDFPCAVCYDNIVNKCGFFDCGHVFCSQCGPKNNKKRACYVCRKSCCFTKLHIISRQPHLLDRIKSIPLQQVDNLCVYGNRAYVNIACIHGAVNCKRCKIIKLYFNAG